MNRLSNPSEDLSAILLGVQTRWASPENPRALKGQAAQSNGGRKGRASVPLKAGESLVLAEEASGHGTIRRIWMTLNERSPEVLRGLRLQAFWDGAESPAIDVPAGDFFGTGLGIMVPFQSAILSNPEGRSFNCCLPMPFRAGFRLVLHNESPADIAMLFYDVNYTIGEEHGDVLYLHAYWNRERRNTLKRDFQILPKVRGRGRFLGANFGVAANQKLYAQSWWGEGEVKIFLDGDEAYPTLCGTGTEDYIGTAWGLGPYAHLYQGCHFADAERFRYCFYRYHIPDPVYFVHEARVTIQQIGYYLEKDRPQIHELGTQLYRCGEEAAPIDLSPGSEARTNDLYEREGDDWSACAYFYLDRPENDLPALQAVSERIHGLDH